MNKLLLSILLVLFYTVSSYSQSGWHFLNPIPTDEKLTDVKMFSSQNAVVVGYTGTFMRTSDGGNTWSSPLSTYRITGLLPYRFESLFFFNENTGWVIGNNVAQPESKLFKTTNNGITWNETSSFSGYSFLRTVYFVNQTTGWIGGMATVLKTTNGGSNWYLQANLQTAPESFFFLDTSNGYLCGSEACFIYKTTNGGQNWNPINSQALGYHSLYFFNVNTGVAAGYAYGNVILIKKTTNGGSSWVTKLSGNHGSLSKVFFINNNTGWAVGGDFTYGTINDYGTTDGGENWFSLSPNVNEYITSVCFSDPNTGIAVGYNGRILRTTNSGHNWIPSYKIIKDNLNSVCFVNSDTGWVLGNDSCIYKTTNSGNNWFQQVVGSPYNSSLYFLDVNTGYLVNWGHILMKSTNGGNQWMQLVNFSLSISHVFFKDALTGWCSGEWSNYPYYACNRILKTTNGGNTWDSTFFPNGIYLIKNFEFINDQTGWAIGGGGRVFKTTNAGLNWISEQSGTNNFLRYIDFYDENTGWVAGDNMTIIKTTNGGQNWFSQSFPINGSGNSGGLKFTNAYTGWAVTNVSGARIWKTTTGGNNWVSIVDIGIHSINSMSCVNDSILFCVGDDGTIISNSDRLVGIYPSPASQNIPKAFSLSQNYPNPFNPNTKIKFSIPLLRGVDAAGGRGVSVRLIIYDLLGREVATLVNEQLKPGTYEVEFDGTDYPSGVYFYKLITADYTDAKRMVIVK